MTTIFELGGRCVDNSSSNRVFILHKDLFQKVFQYSLLENDRNWRTPYARKHCLCLLHPCYIVHQLEATALPVEDGTHYLNRKIFVEIKMDKKNDKFLVPLSTLGQ